MSPGEISLKLDNVESLSDRNSYETGFIQSLFSHTEVDLIWSDLADYVKF